MTGSVNGHGHERPAAPELVVVHVRDAINPTLAGHGDISYQSPPQTREEALALIRILLGRREQPSDTDGPWRCPIAGGQRTVTVRSVRADDASAKENSPSMA